MYTRCPSKKIIVKTKDGKDNKNNRNDKAFDNDINNEKFVSHVIDDLSKLLWPYYYMIFFIKYIKMVAIIKFK